MIITTKQHPTIAAALRGHTRKHKCIIRMQDTIECTGTCWDGGSRSSWWTLTTDGKIEQIPCPSNPPQFGGGKAPTVNVPEGGAILTLGTLPATPALTIREADKDLWMTVST